MTLEELTELIGIDCQVYVYCGDNGGERIYDGNIGNMVMRELRDWKVCTGGLTAGRSVGSDADFAIKVTHSWK